MVVTDKFCFSPEKFDKLFPFFVLIDQNNVIVANGSSIEKVCGIKPGISFATYFNIKRPTVEYPGFVSMDLVDQVVILESVVNNKITLRGQIEYTKGGQFIFVGSPWFSSMDELIENRLSIRDFAIHDPITDLLHVLQTQEATTREIKELLVKVNQQKNVVKESEERISSLVLNLQTGILLEDENRHIVLCNKMFCDIFHVPIAPELLKGNDCNQAAVQTSLLFKDSSHFIPRISQILADRRMVLSEQLELVDGRILERDYMPIFVHNRYRGHLWKYTDITDRVNSTKKLRLQEEKYRSIIENMKLGIVETDLQGSIKYVNNKFCELSGFQSQELIGKVPSKVFQVENGEEFESQKLALRKRGVSDGYEVVVKNKKGQARWWFVSGAPNYNDAGEHVGSIGIHLDLTERRILEEELRVAKEKAEESSQAKESFLANMSHEIRTPLNAIIGLVREMKRFDNSEKGKIYLGHAESVGQHLLSIVNNILDISKIEAGEFHLESRTFDLRSVLMDVESILGSSAKEKLLDLQIIIRDGISPALVGDDIRIRQILLNIVSNAVKFTNKGSIIVELEAINENDHSQKVRIRISDTGVGMDKKYHASLFKKFSQEDLSIARKFGGTGLGMAITHELLQMMDGTIDVESDKGKGTKFEITLTLRKGDIQQLLVCEEREQTACLHKLRILLVEDNELNRLVAINTLSRQEIEVVEAFDGQMAIDILSQQPFDVILMDLQMPGMGGLEAATFIRKKLRMTTPIIALTANAFKKEIENCREAGMDDYVTKPFEEKVLLSTIVKAIGKVGSGTTQNHVSSAPAVEPSREVALYNLNQIRKLSNGSIEFESKMISLFCESIPKSVRSMIDMFNAHDLVRLRAAAHKIKPTLAIFNIHTLHDDVRFLEDLNENENDEMIKNCLEKLRDCIDLVVTDLLSQALEQ